MTERIRIDDLHISIERRDDVVRAVDGVSLSLAGNEILALVGESGSGKTLTARSALKLLPRGATTRGAVLVEGQDVLSVPGDTLRKIRGGHAAMVFQEPSTALNPVYTIGWQLEEGLRAHGIASRAERYARGLQALRDVGIPEPERRYHDYPHQFSGGQKQRIVIAMALSLKPGVIIADEPTTALDVTVQAEILDLLRKCRDELGTAIILITHNMGVVADLADRVAVMYQGKVVETADVHSLFARPQHPYTRQLLASVPRFGQAVRPQRPPAADEPPVLRAEKLEITYPGRFRKPPFRAVRGVDFEVRKGEIFGLVGESGSGKSTIGRAIAGLTATSGGVLEFLGTDLRRASRAEVQRLRRKLGFVFQDPASSFNPFMSIADCIAEPMRIHRVPAGKRGIDARVRELLEAVQLPSSFASRTPMELSGGQRQRVGVARALALKPEFVIADEPTSALDVSVQATILRLLGELHEELGFAALFITHDLAVVEEFADRVGVLKQGEFMEIAPAETLLKEARDPYTRALIDAVPIPDPVAQRAKRKRAV
ncbi:dipeptide ABC transporter ATP-binding protein [Sediminivirga luteola]|uniref:dipeptide ABC transporter ATP-binding protein n=1 Tax=Sediminivirga luteola TaxID=1774748 RepID=UPI001F589ED4|nr:ABC transporter ATP-binding protein [Sediminivirga luteola]MCI2264467.1 ABC transporter ATP-binding protein [Sediminivirga luteola]